MSDETRRIARNFGFTFRGNIWSFVHAMTFRIVAQSMQASLQTGRENVG